MLKSLIKAWEFGGNKNNKQKTSQAGGFLIGENMFKIQKLDLLISIYIGFLFSLILPYWLLKYSMSIIETPLVYLGVMWLREEKRK